MKSKFISLVVAAVAAMPVFAHEGHDHAAAATAPTTCIVSGDKLGAMGEPVAYTYKQAGKPDRVLQFCCKDCIADFEKDPAKYLAKLDAVAAGEKTSDAKTAGKADACCELIDKYTPVSEALAADDLAKGKTAAASLAQQADTDGMATIAKAAHAIAGAKNISAARESLKGLSAELAPMADGSSYIVMTCPMAQADWIQTDKNVRNPYYGKSMLTCGMVKAAK